MNYVDYKGHTYPEFQREGFAAQFTFPFAVKFCQGTGVDVGCNRFDWSIAKALRCMHEGVSAVAAPVYTDGTGTVVTLIDPEFKDLGDFYGYKTGTRQPYTEYNATNFPDFCSNLDFVFSSHCLEHVPHWVDALDYWTTRIRSGGVIYLYLPDYSQVYWRPWNNRKHVHVLSSKIISDYFAESGKFDRIFVGDTDLNNSFTVVAIKKSVTLP